MTQVDKIIEKWRDAPPVEENKERVFSLLDKYFPGQWEFKRGSHIVVRDERLKGFPDYGPDGDFSIVVKNGKKVKKVYLKEILKAIALLGG